MCRYILEGVNFELNQILNIMLQLPNMQIRQVSSHKLIIFSEPLIFDVLLTIFKYLPTFYKYISRILILQ